MQLARGLFLAGAARLFLSVIYNHEPSGVHSAVARFAETIIAARVAHRRFHCITNREINVSSSAGGAIFDFRAGSRQ